MNNFLLRGTGVAMITPFKKDESIDWEAVKKLSNHLVDNGIDYLVIQGTTGESPSITAEEKEMLVQTIASEVEGKVPLVLGIGGNNTYQVEHLLQHTNLEQIDAVLSVCPYYNKPNQEGIKKHYRRVADASPKPIILYNVPGRTGINMTAETQLELANHPNIIATKEASGDLEQMMTIIQNKPLDFELISGDDSLTYPIMAIGGAGVTSVVAHLVPKEFSQMVNLCLQGEYEKAQKIHYKCLGLCRAIFADGSPGGVKHLLEKQGLSTTTLRLPLANVNEETEQLLEAEWAVYNM
jgi:4-hydroxy-tetrahydrodipicolinate synthase